jgi:proline iminopeptidase
MAGPSLSIPRWRKDAALLLSTLPDSVQHVIRENEETGTTDSPEYQAAMMTFYQWYLARKTPWSADIDSSFAMMYHALYGYMEGPSEFTITGIIRDCDATGRLHNISVPTLFIIGQYDEAREPTAAYYDGLMPNSELVVVPDAGHLAMQDDSATYVQDIESFLEQFDDQ